MIDARTDLHARLANRLGLRRPLAFLDLETTGVSVETDRIVEIAIVKLLPAGDVERLESLVNPEGPIPAAATAVHGIGDADVCGAPTFAQLAGEVARMLAGADVAGFNVGRFDLRLLAAELARAGVSHELPAARVIDAMTIFHRNERRDLAAAVRFYSGREHDGHRALADAEASIEVLAAQLDRYPALPTDAERLFDYCGDRRTDWLTADGRLAWRDGAARITFGKHSGKSLQTLVSEAPDYLRWMLERDFADDVKRLVSAALDGVLPAPPAAGLVDPVPAADSSTQAAS